MLFTRKTMRAFWMLFKMRGVPLTNVEHIMLYYRSHVETVFLPLVLGRMSSRYYNVHSYLALFIYNDALMVTIYFLKERHCFS